MIINTNFYKFLIILIMILIILLLSSNLKEFYVDKEKLKPLEFKAKLENKQIILKWIKPDIPVSKYKIVLYENNKGPNFIEPKIEDLESKYNNHIIKNFDETKKYKFAIYYFDKLNNKSEISSFSEIDNIESKLEEKKYKTQNYINCNKDGTYNILNKCINENIIESNYTDLSYKVLKKNLSKQPFRFDIDLISDDNEENLEEY